MKRFVIALLAIAMTAVIAYPEVERPAKSDQTEVAGVLGRILTAPFRAARRAAQVGRSC